ncbi:MAG: hypothetical protein ACYC56_13835 [Candidatus Aquicultor sp.]
MLFQTAKLILYFKKTIRRSLYEITNETGYDDWIRRFYLFSIFRVRPGGPPGQLYLQNEFYGHVYAHGQNGK